MQKRLFAILSVLAPMLAAISAADAQPIPVPPLIRIVVPFGAGSSTDIVARASATQLAARLGTTVVVENRAGGSTMIGAAAVANGPHDGSMILITTPSTVSAAAVMQKIPFDMDKDLIPVSILSDGPMMMATSSASGIKTPADLANAAKARPGTLTYGTSGVGSLPHLSTELFADAAKVQLRHVPYKGGSFAVVDLSAGTIDLMLGTFATFAPHIAAGRVYPVGVSSAQPSPAFPAVKTLGSVAPGYVGSVWIAAFVQAGTPAVFAQRLNTELNEISRRKEITTVSEGDGAVPVAATLDELRTRMRNESLAWRRIATDKKVVLE